MVLALFTLGFNMHSIVKYVTTNPWIGFWHKLYTDHKESVAFPSLALTLRSSTTGRYSVRKQSGRDSIKPFTGLSAELSSRLVPSSNRTLAARLPKLFHKTLEVTQTTCLRNTGSSQATKAALFQRHTRRSWKWQRKPREGQKHEKLLPHKTPHKYIEP